MKLSRNRQICAWYRNGMRGADIARKLHMDPHSIYPILQKWYPVYYNTPYVGRHSEEYKKEFYEELYKRYRQYYIPGAQTLIELLQLMDCSVSQFNKLCEIYHLNYQRMGIFKTQKTLCNVPEAFYNHITAFAKKMGFKSLRQFAVCAINEYILQYEEKELVENDTED